MDAMYEDDPDGSKAQVGGWISMHLARRGLAVLLMRWLGGTCLLHD